MTNNTEKQVAYYTAISNNLDVLDEQTEALTDIVQALCFVGNTGLANRLHTIALRIDHSAAAIREIRMQDAEHHKTLRKETAPVPGDAGHDKNTVTMTSFPFFA